MLALLTQSYKTFLPQTNNQLRTSSNTKNQATVQDGRVVVQIVHGRQNRGQGMNPWGGVDPLALMFNVSHQHYYSPSSSTSPSTYVPPHLADNAHLDSSLSLTDNLIENLTNMLALLTQSYKTFLPQTNNQLRTSSSTRNQATVQDGRVVVQIVHGRQNRGQGMNP
nr:integrase, catalytic region, zinc finger, CCHC-type, peptidase aspartic, catalytic [Tanacetum cinerariifolium]